MALQFLSPIHKSTRQITLYLDGFCRELEVSPREGHLLSYLRTYAPCPVGELMRVFGLKASTLTSMLERLEQRKLLRREVHPEDRRSFLVRLTPEGRAVAERLQRILESFERRVRERVGEREMEGFRSVLEAIAEVTQVRVRPDRAVPAASVSKRRRSS